ARMSATIWPARIVPVWLAPSTPIFPARQKSKWETIAWDPRSPARRFLLDTRYLLGRTGLGSADSRRTGRTKPGTLGPAVPHPPDTCRISESVQSRAARRNVEPGLGHARKVGSL